MEFRHHWKFDWPWEMVDIKDWFYMVNDGYMAPVHFLHVRILGVRSLWTVHPVEDTLGNILGKRIVQNIEAEIMRLYTGDQS